MDPEDERSIPILPSRDLARAVSFYERLGFRVLLRPEGWGYAILARGDRLELHLAGSAHVEPERSESGCYLRVPDAAALHAEWARLGLPGEGIPRMMPLAPREWGMLEFALVDEDGNLVRVGTPLPERGSGRGP